MMRLNRPWACYRRDLEQAFKPGELKGYARTVVIAHDQARAYARKTPKLAAMRTRTNHHARRKFIWLYEGDRVAVQSIKKRVRQTLNDLTAAVCQYCGLAPPRTLDHFLGKAKLPELALYARNLVPCCADCNGLRGAAFSEAGKRQIVHFYDDDVDGFPDVLRAVITFSDGAPVVSFSTAPHASSEAQLYKEHFGALRLAGRYRTQAARSLREYHFRFTGMAVAEISDQLAEEARRKTALYGKNNFHSALCRALISTPVALEWLTTEYEPDV